MLITTIALSGCVVEIHRGNGELATEERGVGSFSGVEAAFSIPVDVEEAGEERVFVTCDRNLLAYIYTRVIGGDLVVEGPPGLVQIVPTVECRASVAGSGLERVASSGSGRLTASGSPLALRRVTDSGSGGVVVDSPIDSPDLVVVGSGSGQISIRSATAPTVELTATGSGWIGVDDGSTDSLDVRVSGSGPVRARGLEALYVDAILSGSGDGEVTALQSLDATLSGSGNLDVWGDPPMRDVVATGSGDVHYRQ